MYTTHPLIRYASLLFVAIATVFIMVVAKTILIPIVIAVLLLLLLNSATDRVHKLPIIKYLPRSVSLITATVIILLVLFFIGNIVARNFVSLSDNIPTYETNLQHMLTQAASFLGIEKIPSWSWIQSKLDLKTIISYLASSATNVASQVILVLLYLAFLIADQGSFPQKIMNIFHGKQSQAEAFTEKLRMISHRIKNYMLVKTGASLLTGIVSYFAMWLLHIDNAPVWALLIFLLNFIPTIGSILAVIFPTVMALVQTGDWQHTLLAGAILAAIQFVVGNIIEPPMMGASLNLSSFVVILSLAVFGAIWGVIGMFLCVPFTVILVIILASFPDTRPVAILLTADGDIDFEIPPAKK